MARDPKPPATAKAKTAVTARKPDPRQTKPKLTGVSKGIAPTNLHVPITEAERGLLAAVDESEICDARKLDEAQRIVRPAFLRALLLGQITGMKIPETGLNTVGLIFSDTLDLSYVSQAGESLPPLRLLAATFRTRADFSGANFAELNLAGSSCDAGISCARLTTLSHLWLDRLTCLGGLNLKSANIGGQLSLKGAQLRGTADEAGHVVGDALSADGVTIKGGAFCDPTDDRRFEACGEVRLLGANIGGQLSLKGARLKGAANGTGCIIGDALSADGATIERGVFCDPANGHRFEADGEIRLLGVNIGGQLSLKGARLKGAVDEADRVIGDALSADGATINGGFFCDVADGHRFEADGEVRLLGSDIGGTFNLKGARLRGAADEAGHIVGDALSADGATIRGGVFCSLTNGYRFEADGLVRIPGTQISGPLNLSGARLKGAANEQGRIVGDALTADGATIKGGVFCNSVDGYPFEAEGSLHILGADIGGQLSLSGARLQAATDKAGRVLGFALAAEKTSIAGPLFLDDEIFVNGTVNLFGARLNEVLLSGRFEGSATKTPAIDLGDVEMKRLRLISSGVTGRGQVCLEGAKADNFDQFDPSLWGTPPDDFEGLELDLDGFTYRRAEFSTDRSSKRARKWAAFWWSRDPIAENVLDLIDRSFVGDKPTRDDYKPQPFEQAAKVLRESGHGKSADEVAVAKREFRRITRADGRFATLMSCVSLAFFRYGYGRFRASLWTVVFVLLGAIGVWQAQALDILMTIPEAGRAAQRCAEVPVAFALDTFLPLVDLGVEKRCRIDASQTQGQVAEAVRVTYAVIGWLFIPMVALTFAGVLRKD